MEVLFSIFIITSDMDSVQLLSSQTPTSRQDDEFREDQLFYAFSADFQQTTTILSIYYDTFFTILSRRLFF